jgi:DNA-directed RNA polymerase subunit RPC12/RpoP
MNWILPVQRYRQMTLKGYRFGHLIAHCFRCPFQYPPETLGPNVCPDCGGRMHVTTLDADLVRVHAGGEIRP